MAEATFDSNGLAEEDGLVTIYHYDVQGIYTTTETIERKKGQGIPANCTREAPPQPYPAHCWPQWVNGAWAWIADFRGTIVYNTQTKQSRQVREFGPVPANETTEVPPNATYLWDSTERKWVADLEAEKRERDSVVAAAWERNNQDMVTMALLGKKPGPKMAEYTKELYTLYQQIERPDYLPKLPEDFLS